MSAQQRPTATRSNRGFGPVPQRLPGYAAATLLLAAALLLGGCPASQDSGTSTPPTPVTSIVLTGVDDTTRVVSNRFGVPTATEVSPGVFQYFNGVEVTLTSSVGGQTYYKWEACAGAGVFTAYSAASKPRWDSATPVGNELPLTGLPFAAQSQAICYYSVANGITEGARDATLYFDPVAPTAILRDSLGNDPGAAGQVYTSFPSFRPSFDTTLAVPDFYTGEGGLIYYTTNGDNPLSAATAAEFGLTASPSISVTAGVGASTFPYSDAHRVIKLLVVDDVGNEGTVQSFTVTMDLMATDPSAGYYTDTVSLKLTPPVGDFLAESLSAAYVLLCRYTDPLAGYVGYECDDADGATDYNDFPGIAGTETDPTTADYPYGYGYSPPTDSEVLTLPAITGRTVVYDMKILQDSDLTDGTGVTDAPHQALFVVDQDAPQLKIYPDPDLTTDDTLQAKASVFDEGFYVVREAQITNYSLDRDVSNACTVIDPLLGTDTCYDPIAPSITLPPSAKVRPADNQAVSVQATAADGAGNNTTDTVYMPIGRSVAAGGATATTANLGHALAAGLYNGSTGANLPPDYAVSEPGYGGDQGAVYVFHNGIRTQIAFTSQTVSTIDVSGGAQLVLDVTVDGTTTSQTVDLQTPREFISSTATSVGIAELVNAFNAAVMSLATQAPPVALNVYMAAIDQDGNGVDDAVQLISDSGQLDTCISIGGGTLQTALQLGYLPPDGSGVPVTQACVWDEKIAGEAVGDQFGYALATGDFDGDDVSDLAIGAPKANGGTGRVYIYYGDGATTAAFGGTLYGTVFGQAIDPAATADTIITGAAAGDDFGWSLAAGDLNADAGDPVGDDLLVGAPGTTEDDSTLTARADAGRIYLFQSSGGVFGAALTAAGATSSQKNPRSSNESLYMAGERFGHALLVADLSVEAPGLPDVDEIAVGTPGAETIEQLAVGPAGSETPGRVWFFRTDGFGGITPVATPYVAEGGSPDAKYGWALGYAGRLYQDVCLSTEPCLAVGAPGEQDAAGNAKGRAYIGQLGNHLAGSSLYFISGQSTGDRLGLAFASADLDDDGNPDLVIGQGGGPAPVGSATINLGGIGILYGRSAVPVSVGTSLTFDRHFVGIDVDPATGGKLETRFGGAILAVAGDPVAAAGKIDRLVIGAPGGQRRYLTTIDIAGRLHVFHRVTFQP